MIATVAGCLVGSVLLAAPASAHTFLVSSSPADGARVDTVPTSVRLTFDDVVEPVGADQVISATTGERVDTGAPHRSDDGATLVLALRPDLPQGTYTAVWRVVSADTHVLSGSITFGVGVDPAAPPPAADEQRTGPLDVAAAVAQGLVYSGMILLFGLAAAARLWWPRAIALRRLRVTVRLGWLFAFVATAGLLLLQGPRADGRGWPAGWQLVGLDQTFDEAYGWQLAARLALLLLVAPLLTRRALTGPSRRREVLGGVAGIAVLLTVALAGHGSVGTDVPLALTAAMVHLLAMTVWLGGVTALAVVVLPASGAAGRVTAESMRRWSLAAYVCVALLVVSGEYQAARQLEPVQALWSTSYGLVLLVKVGLVAIVLVAAAYAHRRLRTATPDGFLDDGVTAAIRHSVRLESATAVLVVAATAVLVSQPPGNTTYGPPATFAAPLGADTVRISVDTTRRGRQVFELEVVDRAGRPAPTRTITATLSSANVASLALRLQPATAGGAGSAVWRSAAISVPMAGTWTIALDVTLDQTNAYATTAQYRVW